MRMIDTNDLEGMFSVDVYQTACGGCATGTDTHNEDIFDHTSNDFSHLRYLTIGQQRPNIKHEIDKVSFIDYF